ncbi:MAG: hypothetical protein ACPLRX_00255 [Candidatus Saccharicenans sp.]
MGIKRCPYCRALISEEDQYCRNCGTQLLFPEDEKLEEEIPGDKIIEVEEAEEATTRTGFLSEEGESKARIEETEEQTNSWAELDEETFEEDEQDEQEEEIEEEQVILVDEEEFEPTGETKMMDDSNKEERKKQKEKTPAELLFEDVKTPLLFPEENLTSTAETELETGQSSKTQKESNITEKVEELEKELLNREADQVPPQQTRPGFVTMAVEGLKREIESHGVEEKKAEPGEKKGPGPVTELIQELTFSPEEEAKKQTTASDEALKPSEAEENFPTFSTAELDNLGPTVDLGRHQVEEFLELLENKEKQAGEGLLQKDKDTASTETGDIPGWLKEVKNETLENLPMEEGGTVAEIEMGEETTEEEWEEEKPVNPTIGFPERLTRDSSEFDNLGQETAEELEMVEEEEEETEISEIEASQEDVSAAEVSVSEAAGYQGVETESIISSLGFKNYIKAKIFDLLFVGLFWLISIWLAARSMDSTIFRLLEIASTGLLVYLLILIATYFFLFYFFIGETLGDRLFKEEGESDS